MTSAATIMHGTATVNTDTMPPRPKYAAAAMSTHAMAAPSHTGRPSICSPSAPMPAAMMHTTPNSSTAVSTPTTVRSHGMSARTISASIVSMPVRALSRRSSTPVPPSSATASTSPKSPRAPNAPKYCHSSCPDTYPAPRKHPANVSASRSVPIFWDMMISSRPNCQDSKQYTIFCAGSQDDRAAN